MKTRPIGFNLIANPFRTVFDVVRIFSQTVKVFRSVFFQTFMEGLSPRVLFATPVRGCGRSTVEGMEKTGPSPSGRMVVIFTFKGVAKSFAI